jgi:hypothetical protein
MKMYATRVMLLLYIIFFTLLICYHVAVVEYSRQVLQVCGIHFCILFIFQFAVDVSESRLNGLERSLVRRRELEQLEYDRCVFYFVLFVFCRLQRQHISAHVSSSIESIDNADKLLLYESTFHLCIEIATE